MISHAAAALRNKKISSVELTEECLRRIERFNPALNAFVTVTGDRARARASALDAELSTGRDRGPLHGIPIALKDLVYTKGVRTTAGSKLFADFVPDCDATIVAMLEQAGAVVVGKTGLHELAYGITSNNPHFGVVRNPWDPERIPGGSSGGSGAAVVAGMAFMAIGSDTGGSIRIPASFCGCAGLKPTYGRVSKYGVFPLGFSLDHIGPLAATVRDCAITLNAIAGHDPLDPTTSKRPVEDYCPEQPSMRGVRIGRPENFYYAPLDPEVAQAIENALKKAAELGAEIVPVCVPDIDELNAIARVILLAEAAAALEPHASRRADIGADVLALLDQGRVLPATAYIQAQRLRRMFIGEFSRVWDRVDCLAAPTTPTPAPRIGESRISIAGVEEDVRLATTRLVRGVNALGVPALSLPCGLTAGGLPVGLQLIGPAFSERMLLGIGAALEDALSLPKRAPQY
jgi:aspartyl-tRNA(Asn)/glutamyl-tRNA(Gln) amidotransferase subunit A